MGSLEVSFYAAIFSIIIFSGGILLGMRLRAADQQSVPSAVQAARNVLLIGEADRNAAMAEAIMDAARKAYTGRTQVVADVAVFGCAVLVRSPECRE